MKPVDRMSRDELADECIWLRDRLAVEVKLGLEDFIERRFGLTKNQGRVVSLLARLSPRPATKAHIMETLYAGRDEPEAKIVDVMISRIRIVGSIAIETVHGRGYRVDPAVAAEILNAERMINGR